MLMPNQSSMSDGGQFSAKPFLSREPNHLEQRPLKLIVILAPAVVAFAGFFSARYAMFNLSLNSMDILVVLSRLSFIVGGVLGVAGLFPGRFPGRDRIMEGISSVLLVNYVVVSTVLDPMIDSWKNIPGVLTSVAWLSGGW